VLAFKALELNNFAKPPDFSTPLATQKSRGPLR
jgi:hypothetical protein